MKVFCGFWCGSIKWELFDRMMSENRKSQIIFTSQSFKAKNKSGSYGIKEESRDNMYLDLTEEEKAMLVEIRNTKRFPIVRLELHSSEQKELVNTALNYVRINDPDDSMEVVKARGKVLQTLMERGFVFIDYTVHVWVSGDYDVYYKSKIYELLCHTVMESAKRPGTVFNLPYMKKGYASLTHKGEKAAAVL